MQEIQHEVFNGIHRFSFNKKDIKVTLEEITESPDEDSGDWRFDGFYDTPPIAGYNKRYAATGKIYQNTIYSVACPICGEMIVIKKEKGDMLRSYKAEDCRM